MKSDFHFFSGPEIPAIAMADGLPSPADLASESEMPDARLYLVEDDGAAVGHVALWWKQTPLLDGTHVGAIGGFTARDGEIAKALLGEASSRLQQAGCKTVVGPMNGNTWQKHRFVIESDRRGSFLLEPRNPSEYPAWWRDAGFSELSRYSSSAMKLAEIEAIPLRVKERLERSGVIVRPLDPQCYDDELRRIHAVSLASFSNNFLYTPLREDEFLDAYRKVRERVDPDFVRLAEREGRPCGFVFGIPDLEAAARGEKPALIVKTLAVDPGARCAGLGSVLVDEIHRAAKAKGYVEAIHALQHETNTSLKITGRHHGHAFRRYALFSKKP